MAGYEQKTADLGQAESVKASQQGHKQSSSRQKKSQQHKGARHGETFKGDREALEGFVYTYDGYVKASQFQKTTEKIGEWAKQNCVNFPLDVWKGIDSLEEPNENDWRPEAPADVDDVVEGAIFKDQIQTYGRTERAYRDNSTKVFDVVCGQCLAAAKAKARGLR